MKLKVKYQEARNLWARMLALTRLARCWHNDKQSIQTVVHLKSGSPNLYFLVPPPNLGAPFPDLILHWQPTMPRLGPHRLDQQQACSLPILTPLLPRRKASEPLCSSFEALISIFLFITLSYVTPSPLSPRPSPTSLEWSTGWLVGGLG